MNMQIAHSITIINEKEQIYHGNDFFPQNLPLFIGTVLYLISALDFSFSSDKS